MPWQEVSTMSLRKEFVMQAIKDNSNIRELCRRFGITPRTGYKWLGRYQVYGEEGLMDRSRRPVNSPSQTPSDIEQAVLDMRTKHPAWGGRKIKARLETMTNKGFPPASTITAILRRNGMIDAEESTKHTAWQRFEHDSPNKLWQMDFKGHFPIYSGRCHPLTLLDDHSRFALGIEACGNERGETVKERLIPIFRRYGLPDVILSDNGGPWGYHTDHTYTSFSVWLLRLDIKVSHGRPYHPQTQGKDERFHRTLKAEVLKDYSFTDLLGCQRAFDQWRDVYNMERPHEALGLDTPASRYKLSPRPYPEVLPPIEYGDNIVRKVHDKGHILFRGRKFVVGKAFHGFPLALRPTLDEQVWDVFFSHHKIATIDIGVPDEV
jgi:transposase InsO family protein/transposase-like protein